MPRITTTETAVLPALRLPQELAEQIDSLATKESRSRPDMIRVLLRRGIAATDGDKS